MGNNARNKEHIFQEFKPEAMNVSVAIWHRRLGHAIMLSKLLLILIYYPPMLSILNELLARNQK